MFKLVHHISNNKALIHNELYTNKHKCIKTAYNLIDSINSACTTLLISLIKLRASQDICNAFVDYILNIAQNIIKTQAVIYSKLYICITQHPNNNKPHFTDVMHKYNFPPFKERKNRTLPYRNI